MGVDVFFFFKQKTAYEMRISDWSSDVCSSDLYAYRIHVVAEQLRVGRRLDDGPVRNLDRTGRNQIEPPGGCAKAAAIDANILTGNRKPRTDRKSTRLNSSH